MTGWLHKPLSEIGAGLRSGDVSATALFEEAAGAHAKHGDLLNAYRAWDEAYSREQAKAADDALREGRDTGPLMGIPVSAKDLFGIARFDTFAGTPKALPTGWSQEGPFIRAVMDQGAVITGKTHMVEFAFGGLGTNPHWPIPRNPWDAKSARVSGGSSSGAGVSLMEGSCLVALGSDTAGSVRVPASMTGTVGLKVTAGRWPLDGIVPLSPTLDTPGILTRSAGDAALVFSSIDARCGKGEGKTIEPADLGGVTIGLCERHFWDDCPDDIDRVLRKALAELEGAGARIVSVDVPETQDAFELFKLGSVVASELMGFLDSDLPDWKVTLDPIIAYRTAGALGLDSDEIAERRKRMREIVSSVDNRFEGIDVLVSPTVPITAPRLSEVEDVKSYSAANGRALRNTCIANIAGLCAITLPAGLDAAGIPVGLQLMARGNSEENLLAIAQGVEQCIGTPRERLGSPPLGA